MNIRTYERGDEGLQVALYNEGAGPLPKFKPASLDEVRRRIRAADFDPGTRFYAFEEGEPVGYATFQENGRVSYPWCRPGHASCAGPLLERVLEAMRARGLRRAFAAYRADWPGVQDFFLAQGFQKTREVVNFVLDLADMPTPAARPVTAITPLTAAEVPAVFAMAPEALRAANPAELERHLLHNPYFPPEAVFVLRNRKEGVPVACGVLVENATYADPKQLDAHMPCFRLGAFGSEGMTAKRVSGLFSFVASKAQNVNPLGLDLLGYVSFRLRKGKVECVASQVPSDVPHLLRFYEQIFRKQGSFPVLERAL